MGGSILQRSLRGGTLTGKAAARELRRLADLAESTAGGLDGLGIADVAGLAGALAGKEAVGVAGGLLDAHEAAIDPHSGRYLTPDTGAALLATHAGRTDNPHATQADQTGALWAPGMGPGGGAVYNDATGGLVMNIDKTPPDQVMAV